MRSDGLSGSRPRKAAMRKCSIIGCLLLLLLSNCSTATDLGGDTYRRICNHPGRHAHGGRLWLPRCGSGRGRNGQSYSINIFGLSTSCPLPPPAIHRAIPCGDTMMPFCDGLYEPRTMGRGLFIILLLHNSGYDCSLLPEWCR